MQGGHVVRSHQHDSSMCHFEPGVEDLANIRARLSSGLYCLFPLDYFEVKGAKKFSRRFDRLVPTAINKKYTPPVANIRWPGFARRL